MPIVLIPTLHSGFCYIPVFAVVGAHVHQVLVWDLPTRLFHWLLVLLFAGLIASGELGGEAMVWHFRLGYGVLVLLLFRIIWGVVGGPCSRFSVFVRSPMAALRYVRGTAAGSESLGHNPLGAYSVMALLFLLLVQVLTGMFSDDEISTTGPLAKLATAQWISWASQYHADIGKGILIGLVLFHVAALLFYRWRGQRSMIPAMWHGFKPSVGHHDSVRDDARTRVFALLCLAVCAGAVSWLLDWAG